ncbi:ABC transporter ATP-binding protein [Acetobacter sp. DmW_136]|uniref:ABC transporter ATP-binding protein n=1 Tax=Acetobacter sp. DmW_136 TaxID=2591091 RepID=UPI0012386FF6|nr:ABC transporter ATP-binding protein [Acetobacter sp. DmW_136]KAA8383632.1 ABC transporter ATP-binding protein [Acetobacter sp. DmW_136]
MSYRSSDRLSISDYISQYKARFYVVSVFSVLTALSALIPLVVLSQLFRSLPAQSATRIALFLLPAVFLPFLCQGATSVLCHRLAFDVVRDLRRAILNLTQRLPADYTTSHRAMLKKLALDDSAEFETAIAHTFPDTIISLVTVVVSLLFLVVISPVMALASVGLLPVAAWAWRQIGRVASGNGRAWHRADVRINQNIMACLEGLMTLKVFNRPPSSLPLLTEALQDVAHLACDMTYRSRWSYVMVFMCVGTNLLVVLPCAMFLHMAQGLGLPDCLFSILLGMGLMTPLQRLMFVSGTLPRLRATLGRLNALQIENTAQDAALHSSVTVQAGGHYDVVFENVSLERPENENVLTSFSLTCPAGQVTGIVGASGAGKSTLLQLASGNLKPTSGRVLIGGQDLESLAPQAIGQLVCPVFQHPVLLGHSLADNLLLYRPDLAESDLMNVLAECDLLGCVKRFGLNGPIGRNGARLSGGERQRLAIARALVSRAPVILLDEPTAFVDPEREFHIQKALARTLEGRTILIVAHRLATVREAAQIAVMEHGHLTALGCHEDLMEKSALYGTYARHQFGDGAMP